MTDERYIIMAHRSAASVCGAMVAPLKQGNEQVPPLAKLYAKAICDSLNANVSSNNVHYTLQQV